VEAGAAEKARSGAPVSASRRAPSGVYVIRDGDARWRPAVDVNRIVLGGQLVAITALITLRPILMRWLGSRSAAG